MRCQKRDSLIVDSEASGNSSPFLAIFSGNCAKNMSSSSTTLAARKEAAGNSSPVLPIVSGNCAKSISSSSTTTTLAARKEVAAAAIVRPQAEDTQENLPRSTRRSFRLRSFQCCSDPGEASCSRNSSATTTTACKSLPREEKRAKRKASVEDQESSRNVRHRPSLECELPNEDDCSGSVLEQRVEDELVPLVEATNKQQEEADDEIENDPLVGDSLHSPATKQVGKEVYLVNSTKFYAVAALEKGLQTDEHSLNLDTCSKNGQARETAHQIIQCRVR
jgi:hypothetical protein